MGKILLLGFIIASVFVVQAMVVKCEADEKNTSGIKTENENVPKEMAANAPSLLVAGVSNEGKEELEEAESPSGIRRLGKHHSSSGSVAGGGVILGGFVTAIFAAVFSYIRVTRRRNDNVDQ